LATNVAASSPGRRLAGIHEIGKLFDKKELFTVLAGSGLPPRRHRKRKIALAGDNGCSRTLADHQCGGLTGPEPATKPLAAECRSGSLILLGFRSISIVFVLVCSGCFWCETGAVTKRLGIWDRALDYRPCSKIQPPPSVESHWLSGVDPAPKTD
jgi:hypothetical protein